MPPATRSTKVTAKKSAKSSGAAVHATPQFDWRTTDEEEIRRREERAREEQPRIRTLATSDPAGPWFEVASLSGMTYRVEIRDIAGRRFSCTCTDFQNNGLGTCKHVESVLLFLSRRRKKTPAAAAVQRAFLVPDEERKTVRLEGAVRRRTPLIERLFDARGVLRKGVDTEEAIAEISRRKTSLAVSQDVEPWLERERRKKERILMRRSYEAKVRSGEYPAHETRVPLFPYQREGMLHLAFKERALLADEMGLGKTIQAIAACALLHRLGLARRVLVISPASLKTEWEEQIERFTDLPHQVLFGQRHERMRAFANPPFFTLVNYEQIIRDSLEINRVLRPDIVILDEAQRIKNWSTKTAQAIKRLESRYAFVLTGTPIENRIDELYSLVDFLDPSVFGPLFRFNREFYVLDERGRPKEYKNLALLHDRVAPLMLRRRKHDVETELPGRTDRNLFVPLSPAQAATYDDHLAQVRRLVKISERRPLRKEEQDKLMRELAMMRMVCDSNFILDPEDRESPKVDELERVLEDCLEDPEVKVIIFSEWERMLQLIRERLERRKVGFAWHTGSVPQRRRRGEILAFKGDPKCRIFLSTDSGGVGLNLQNASVVINCDLPWNPAKLEQRIGRAWRKHQTRAVTVINLVAENTIEHRMLGTLAAKQGLADGVLDQMGDLAEIRLKAGASNFLSKLKQFVGSTDTTQVPPSAAGEQLPADRSQAFAVRASQLLGKNLITCEERFPNDAAHSVIVVTVADDASTWRERLSAVHEELLGRGKVDPLAPVRLEVIDRASADVLTRLVEAGLIQVSQRATRQLHPAATAAAMPVLSAEERARIETQRDLAHRKLKMARVLMAEDLAEEAREPLGAALLATARAVAVRARLSEPGSCEELLLAPLSLSLAELLPSVRQYRDGAPIDLAQLGRVLEPLLRGEG